jgi:selenocysteine lyase/cysteine desulfurase
MIEAIKDKSKIYCNNAGGSQMLNSVIDYMAMYMKKYYVQLNCENEIGDDANDLVKEAKHFVDILINNTHGIVEYGSSTTQMARNLSNSIPNTFYEEVVLCTALHYSMITPFETKAVKLKWWIPNQNFSFDYYDLFKLISKSTTMVIIPHVSNITGVVLNLDYIVSCIKNINNQVKILVDGVSYLPHDVIDVHKWQVDFYFISFYKFLGPHISALYIKNHDELITLNHYFLNKPKLELGTFSNESLVGLLGIRDHMMCDQYDTNEFNRDVVHTFFEEVKTIENELLSIFDVYLDNLEQIELISDKNATRVPIFSIQFQFYEVKNINLHLNQLGIMSACGTFYCNKFLTKDVLRISLMHYNTLDEIDQIFKEIIPFSESYKKQPIIFKMLGGFFRYTCDLYHVKRFQFDEMFINRFNELVQDKHYNISRFRRYSLINTETFQILGTKFLQSKKYNKSINGDILRKYNEINLIDTDCFKNLIDYFVGEVKYKTGIDISTCMVHQIRVEANDDSISPVPEGIHQDGYNFIAIVCVNRKNIMGGVNKVFSLNDELVYSSVLKQGEMLFMNDRELKHYVSDIIRIDNCKEAYRDVLIITTVF